MEKPQSVRCADGKVFERGEAVCVGSVNKIRSRDVHHPAVVGEYPVMVDQSGSCQLFTYTKKIAEVDYGDVAQAA
ncbi:hypothetical protein AB7849_09400 [Rhodanobacter sp. 115]|uniref:hypothetical protein n=1 Tax=Rhodanobacter sp. FW021-MT20 TaxID=1162282 RepID=UPI0034E59A30